MKVKKSVRQSSAATKTKKIPHLSEDTSDELLINWGSADDDDSSTDPPGSGALTIDISYTKSPQKRRGRPPGSTLKNSFQSSNNQILFDDVDVSGVNEFPTGLAKLRTDEDPFSEHSLEIDVDLSSSRRGRRQRSDDYIRRRFLYDDSSTNPPRGQLPKKRGRKRGSGLGSVMHVGSGKSTASSRRGRPPKNRGGLAGRPVTNHRYNQQSQNYSMDLIEEGFSLIPSGSSRRSTGRMKGLTDLSGFDNLLADYSHKPRKKQQSRGMHLNSATTLDIDEYGEFDGSVFEELEIPNDYKYEDLGFSEYTCSNNASGSGGRADCSIIEEIVDDDEFMFSVDTNFSAQDLFVAPISNTSCLPTNTSSFLSTTRRRKSPLKPMSSVIRHVTNSGRSMEMMLDSPGVQFLSTDDNCQFEDGDVDDVDEYMLRSPDSEATDKEHDYIISKGNSSQSNFSNDQSLPAFSRFRRSSVSPLPDHLEAASSSTTLDSHVSSRSSTTMLPPSIPNMVNSQLSTTPGSGNTSNSVPTPATKRMPLRRPSILRSISGKQQQLVGTQSLMPAGISDANQSTSRSGHQRNLPSVEGGSVSVGKGKDRARQVVEVTTGEFSMAESPPVIIAKPPKTETASAHLIQKRLQAQRAAQQKKQQEELQKLVPATSLNTVDDMDNHDDYHHRQSMKSESSSDFDSYGGMHQLGTSGPSIYWSEYEPQIKERKEKVITQDMIDQRPRQAIRKYYSTLKKHLSRQERKSVSPAPFWHPSSSTSSSTSNHQQCSVGGGQRSVRFDLVSGSSPGDNQLQHSSSISPGGGVTSMEPNSVNLVKRPIQNLSSVLQAVRNKTSKQHFKVVLLDDPSGHQEAVLVSNPPILDSQQQHLLSSTNSSGPSFNQRSVVHTENVGRRQIRGSKMIEPRISTSEICASNIEVDLSDDSYGYSLTGDD